MDFFTHSWYMIPLWILGAAAFSWLGWMAARSARPSDTEPERAEKVLRRRFAAGEIDADEYRERLAVLRTPAPKA